MWPARAERCCQRKQEAAASAPAGPAGHKNEPRQQPFGTRREPRAPVGTSPAEAQARGVGASAGSGRGTRWRATHGGLSLDFFLFCDDMAGRAPLFLAVFFPSGRVGVRVRWGGGGNGATVRSPMMSERTSDSHRVRYV